MQTPERVIPMRPGTAPGPTTRPRRPAIVLRARLGAGAALTCRLAYRKP